MSPNVIASAPTVILSAFDGLGKDLTMKPFAGMLLALCSKNNEADVREVFERRLDMPLRP